MHRMFVTLKYIYCTNRFYLKVTLPPTLKHLGLVLGFYNIRLEAISLYIQFAIL